MLKSKFFNILWGVNGILLLLFLTYLLILYISENYPLIIRGSLKKHDRGLIVGKKAEIANDLNVNLQHLMYDSPEKIMNSNYYLMKIVILDKEIPKSYKKELAAMNDISIYMIGAIVNIVFFNEDRTDIHKLLDTYGYIKTINFVGKRDHWSDAKDEKRDYILYEMAFKDTNGDDRINDKDSTAFFISGLNGKKLKQITPFTIQFDSYSFSEDNSEIYFEELEQQGDKDILGYFLKSRKLYYYNVKTNKFGRFEELDKILSSVKQSFKL